MSSVVWCEPVSRSPFRPDAQPETAVAAEQLEHMVEEADAGWDVDLAAVEIEIDRDLGLARLPVYACGPGHERRSG